MATYLELEKLKDNHKGQVCIFGAGIIGRNEAYEILTLAGFKVDFYCDNHIMPGTHIRDGVYVKELQYLYDNKDTILVFLCVSYKNKEVILEQLSERDVKNIVIIDRGFITQFLDSVESADEEVKERYYAIYNDEECLKTIFKRRMGYELDLSNPKTYNEKLQWLKLYDRKSEYTRMVDKYEFKNYVIEKMGEDYVIPTFGVYESVDEIEWDKLPEQFVLKCTHDSGSVVICREKRIFDIAKVKEKLNYYMNLQFFWLFREWPYKDVKPRIIAEKYMQDGERKELRDYKFYCFNGKPRFLYISEGLENHHTARISFITIEDEKWEFAPFKRTDFAEFEELPEKPETYCEMVRIAKILSEDYPFVRVDLYQINGKVYVSEMTFTPGAGFTKIVPEKWDEILGSYIQL